jgi:hypothetical protein
MSIHTPVLRGKPLPKVNALEAVGLTDPDPFTRALFQQTVKETKQEMAAPKPNVAPTDALRQKILAISLFPNIYNQK